VEGENTYIQIVSYMILGLGKTIDDG